MNFQNNLEKTTLIKRYKRFLADVEHPTKGEITVHCPNTGSMKNCWQAGWTAWILDSQNTKRKYIYTWVLAENPNGDFIGINTHFANQLAVDAIKGGDVAELDSYKTVETEVKYGDENSRIDILLTDQTGKRVFVEVKSVTLMEAEGEGFFPDAVTQRGQKHVRELMRCVEQGHRAVLFFLVQHTGIKEVAIARHIDPVYADLVEDASAMGVEIIAYATKINSNEIKVDRRINVKLV